MQRSSKLRWFVLLTVTIGTFVGRLDQTVVNLAIPKIINDFGITVPEAGWIATAYILANAVFVPVWGKLGDTIGRKKVYLIGFAIFIVGSILAGLAWDLSSMIFFRVIQAIASSADYPTAMAIISVTFRQGKERAQALGLWSTAFAASAVLGPLLGGFLIDNFGWRSVFLVNLPIGLIGIAMALLFVDESVSEKKGMKFDWWGAITLGIALSAIVLVLDQGVDWGWLSWQSIACYIVTLVFGLLFYFIDLDHPEPIVDFRFFKESVFVDALVNNFIIFMGMIGCLFLIPLFTTTFLGYSATESGYVFIPMAVGLMIAAPLGVRLTGNAPAKYVIAVSTFVAAVGLFMFTGLDARSSAIDLMIPLFILAFGMGFGMAQRTNIIASAVPESEIGVASSVLALVRNVSGAFGIAIFATILNSSVEDNLIAITSHSAIGVKTAANVGIAYGLAALQAQISAYKVVFLVGTAVLLIGAVLSLSMRTDLRKAKAEVFVEG